jgi:hypothetical protein
VSKDDLFRRSLARPGGWAAFAWRRRRAEAIVRENREAAERELAQAREIRRAAEVSLTQAGTALISLEGAIRRSW